MPFLVRLAALLLLIATPALAQSTARPSGTAAAPAPVIAPSTTPTPAVGERKPVGLNDAPAASAASAKVDINAGSEAQLDTLPGVGAARAKAIIKNRPYTDLADLVTKKVLSQAVFDGAKAQMALANVNTATADDLAKTLPGIGKARSDKIVAGRPYKTPQDLVTKGIITQDVFDKVKDLVVS